MADYYPKSMDARALWHQNWATHLPALATKYGISATILTEVAEDNEWMQYWVEARHVADNLSQQLTAYFNDIAGNTEEVEDPAPIDYSLPGGVPAEVRPGVEFRTRKIARDIKGSMVYAVADGELLGIVSPETGGDDLSGSAPEFTVTTQANFHLEVKFKKMGADALKFEFRHKGGNWQSAGFLISSPGTIAIAPLEPGEAEQIEVRAFYIVKNNVVGLASDTKTAFIAP